MTSAAELPLSALTSQAFVAFTIEADHEFETTMPHVTSLDLRRGGRIVGPWLTSYVMYANLLQFVTADGVTVTDLERQARQTEGAMGTMVAGMQRWGYVTVEPPGTGRSKRPKPDTVVRLTAIGAMARDHWDGLAAEIESRWELRFGHDAITRVRAALTAVLPPDTARLPPFLPVLLFANGLRTKLAGHSGDDNDLGHLGLITLLSRVLMSYAVDFERGAPLSLPLSATVIRALGDRQEGGALVRDLPAHTGVSKEAISYALGLEKHGYLKVGPHPRLARAKLVRLTPAGRAAFGAYRTRTAAVEKAWGDDFGPVAVKELRAALDDVLDHRLTEGLQPPPKGWRRVKPYDAGTKAMLTDPRAALPHSPMVLHRGGYPDGS